MQASLSFFLLLEQRIQQRPVAPKLVVDLLRSKLGDNMAEPDPEAEPTEDLLIISEGNANALVTPVLESLGVEMDDAERAFGLWRGDSRKVEGAEYLLSLEQAVLDRALRHVALLRTLCKSQLENTPAQQLLRTCMRFFKHLQVGSGWNLGGTWVGSWSDLGGIWVGSGWDLGGP